MFVNECFLPGFGLLGQAVSEESIYQRSTNQKQAVDYFRYRRKKKKENRRTVREFDNGTFASDYLNMGKLFCWQLLIVGNFTFAICVLLMIVGNFDFACNVYSGLHN